MKNIKVGDEVQKVKGYRWPGVVVAVPRDRERHGMTVGDLASERYVSLATFRKNGREVRTPVWIARVAANPQSESTENVVVQVT